MGRSRAIETFPFAKVLDLPAAETLSQSLNTAFLEIPMQLRIENMTCGGCVRGVTKAIHSVDPAALVAADPDMRLAIVTTQSAESDVLIALEKVGFPASTVS